MATTFRADTVAGIYAVLDAFRTANPTLLLGVHRARPESFPDLPAAYIDGRDEAVTHSAGVRTRTMRPQVVVVRRITNNEEAMLAFDTLVDALLDAFTAQPSFDAGTMWSDVSIADEDAPFGDYDFAAVRFTFGDVTIMEGRVP